MTTLFARTYMRIANGLVVHCLQVDINLKYLYITLPVSMINSLLVDYTVPPEEDQEITLDYYPLREKYPRLIVKNKRDEFVSANSRYILETIPIVSF